MHSPIGKFFFQKNCPFLPRRFDYDDQRMRKEIRNYDAILWEINQAYPFDFMPWLCNFGFVKRQLEDLRTLCNGVR